MSGQEKPLGAPFRPLTHHREEERFFYERDQELVRELRLSADRERNKQKRAEEKKLHWMRCPRCGGEMQERSYALLKMEVCSRCHGVFFDAGELSILRRLELEVDEPAGAGDFLSKLIQDLDRSSQEGPMPGPR